MIILRFAPHEGSPETEVCPRAKNFGNTFVGSSVSQTFNIFNRGVGDIVVSSISLTGDTAFGFLTTPVLPLAISSGASISVILRFSPMQEVDYESYIMITDDQGRAITSIPMSGRGIVGEIRELPLIENFDDLGQGEIPVAWSRIVDSASPYARLESSYTDAESSPAAMFFFNGSDTVSKLILAAPPLAMAFSTQTLRLKFSAYAPLSGVIQVGILDDPLDPLTFVQHASFELTPSWQQYSFDFASNPGASSRIAFKHAAGGVSLSIWLDSIRLERIPEFDLEVNSLSGNTTPTQGETTTMIVGLHNRGSEISVNYTVGIYHGLTCLATVPGPQLAPGVNTHLRIPVTFVSPGEVSLYARCSLPRDEYGYNDRSRSYQVIVQEAGSHLLTLIAGEESLQNIPFDFSKQNSLYEMLLSHEDLFNSYGTITGIHLRSRMISQLNNEPIKVWMGVTDSQDLSEEWISASEMTLVFEGAISPVIGNSTIELPFNTPFDYRSGQNLAILFQRPMDTIYFSDYNRFLCFVAPPSRARYAGDDFTAIDPLAPDPGELSGYFPALTLCLDPGGVGNMAGRVIDHNGNGIPGVVLILQDTAYQTQTDALGYYELNNIMTGAYTAKFSLYGWEELTCQIAVLEGQTTQHNTTLTAFAMLSITGTILGSDTQFPIPDVNVCISGYTAQSTTTNGDGLFTLLAVYGSHTYQYLITCTGYQTLAGEWHLSETDLTLGEIILPEIADPPFGLEAVQLTTEGVIELSWDAPDSFAVSMQQSFEADEFPPPGWIIVSANNSPPTSEGLYPTWCRIGSIYSMSVPVVPAHGSWQAGLGWNTQHQDEWLISPLLNCPWGARLSFDSYYYGGSTAGDSYRVMVSADQGVSWLTLWDASSMPAGLSPYSDPVVLDLSPFCGQQIKLAWNAVDPPESEGLWHPWFIDNVRLSQLLDRSHVKTSRGLSGYRVYRLRATEEDTPGLWTRLSTEDIQDLYFTDVAWDSLDSGRYRWAVQAVYSEQVLSLPVFSNVIDRVVETGMISGVVRFGNNQPVPRAEISAGTYSTTANLSGAYSLILRTGSYSVTVRANGFTEQTLSGIEVIRDQTTTLNFYLSISGDNDVVAYPTSLLGNKPNPFASTTEIRFTLAEKLPVAIDIYNIRGQHVRTLSDPLSDSGLKSMIWNGRDRAGNAVASGVYYYRFRAGDYCRTGKMLILK